MKYYKNPLERRKIMLERYQFPKNKMGVFRFEFQKNLKNDIVNNFFALQMTFQYFFKINIDHVEDIKI